MDTKKLTNHRRFVDYKKRLIQISKMIMMNKNILFVYFLLGVLIAPVVKAQNTEPMVVKVSKPMSEISPSMWGVFFEDINFAADGGIYAEMVKNRSFEFSQPFMGWKELKNYKSYIVINNRSETNPVNPRFAQITIHEPDGVYGTSNSGFRGMGVKKDLKYHFYILARQNEDSNVKIRVELVDSKDNIIGKNEISPVGMDWKEYSADLISSVSDTKAKLHIWFEGKGIIDIDMVSLFPDDTWKNRPKGLRADLVQLLADMKPGFLRFPGGCIVEGRELATRYQWKKTIGDIEKREMIVNRWNTEFSHKPAPDYYQTFGLGFFEYFQLSEDLGAEPLPILNCGMACQFNTSEVVPLDQLDPYIQDVLDLIEFANGPVDSKWGKIRNEMGHPLPFNLKIIGIGNEQWGGQYIDRYKIFAKTLKEKHPEIKLISDPGPAPDGDMFTYLWKELRALNADIVDEHYYKSPDWFLKNANRYNNYDRKGPKVFAGEYAAQSIGIASPDNKNNWECALSEAAFMTGLERNAEVVVMCSYAPLFAHVEGWQWTPDMIWFDNLKSLGSANYYVQKLFSTNNGTLGLPIVTDNKPLEGIDGLYASAAMDKTTNDIIIKIVNAGDKEQIKEIVIEGSVKLNTSGRLLVLKSDNLKSYNTLENPGLISPMESTVTVKGKKITLKLDKYSFSVVRLKLK